MGAISRSLVIFALVVAIAPAMLSAMQYMVGDNAGWKLGVNYTEWAQGKQFVVGDTLVFMYNNASHNVYKVDGPGFQSCTVPKNNSLRHITGDDTIPLATSGDKWYICGVKGHCSQGMKLKITVLESASPPASNSTPPAAPPASNSTPPASSSAPTLHAIEAPIFQIFSGIIFAVVSMIMTK